jgi:redox-sensitive bicupin YhaK (pirin superfamily)
MGNRHTLTRGQSQYMSAGTGVTHSELNLGAGALRFLQVWIFPDQQGYKPNYGEYRFALEDRFGKWLPLATGCDNAASDAPIKVHADVNVYATILPEGGDIALRVGPDRQAYMVLLEGEATIEDVHLHARDALEIIRQDVTITAGKGAHLFVVEMAYDATCYKAKHGQEETLRNGV